MAQHSVSTCRARILSPVQVAAKPERVSLSASHSDCTAIDLRGLKGEVWFGNARLGGVVLRLALLRFMGTCATLFRRRIEVVGRLAGLAVGEEIAPNRLFGSIGTGHWSPSSMQP